MAKIHTYTTDGTVSIADKIIGTDGDVGANNATKNFTVGSLQTFLGNQFAPKTDFETVELASQVNTSFRLSGDVLGPTGSITTDYVSLGTRRLNLGEINLSSQGSHARLYPFGYLQLCGNSANYSNGAIAVVRAGHVGTAPASSDFGKFFSSALPADGSGTLVMQNETDTRSSIIMLKSTAATSYNNLFVVGASTFPIQNIAANGYGLSHRALLRLTGKADLYLDNGTGSNGNVYARKFISSISTTYYVEPASETKVNEIKANKIKPITTAHLTNASSVFCIPKASATQTNSFSSGNNQTGELGQMLFDDNYIYICTSVVLGGATTWKRVAISAW